MGREVYRPCSTCTCAKMLRTALLPAGWFSTLHGLVKPAMHAVKVGKGLLTPLLPEFTSPRSCSRRDLGCFFEPLVPHCNGSSTDAAQVDLQDGNFVRGEAHAEHGTAVMPQSYRSLGWYWWTSQLLRSLLRPTSALEEAVQSALLEVGLADALASHQRVLGLHVRQGDACLRRELHRMARTCTPLSQYMRHITPYARALNISTIYLATDSERILAETRAFPEFVFLYLQNATRSGTGNAPVLLWDTLVARRARTSSVDDNFVDAWMATIDVLLLSRCHVFVGKFTSTFFRTAHALNSAQCNCVAPFVSLDAPWCFDYGMRAGSNWEFPVRSKSGVGAADNKFWC